MKVKELIKKLSEFDENIIVEYFSGSGWEATGIEVENVEFNEYNNTILIN